MRSAERIIIALAVVAVVGLGAAAALGERSQAFTLGVARSSTVELKPGRTICQAPVIVPDGSAFDGIRLAVGTNHLPGPRLEAAIRRSDAGQSAEYGTTLAAGTLDGGYPDVDQAPDHTVWVGRVAPGESIAVCLENRGRRPAFIFGGADAAARTSTSYLNGKPTGSDLALDFERREPRSLVGLIPAMFDRAALFRAQWVGAWTYWVLAALVLVGAPALLAGAVRAAARESD